MNINKLLVAVKKETERTSKEITSYTIGALARKRRLEKKLTLSEVSKDICSISYLSKIESNKIIPNKRCLELLMERIDVSKWEIYALENCDSIMKELVNAFLYGNTQKLKEMYDDAMTTDNNQCTDIIKIAYYLYHNELDKALGLISDNLTIPVSMTKSILYVFNYLAGLYLTLTNELDEVEKILKKSKEAYFSDELSLLFQELSFIYYVKCGRSILAKKALDYIVNEYKNRMLFHRLERCNLYYSYLLLNEGEYDEVITVCDNLLYSSKICDYELYNYIMAKALYLSDKKMSCIQYINELDKRSKYYPLIADMKYELSNDKDKVIEEMSEVSLKGYTFYIEYFMKNKSGTLTRNFFEGKQYMSYYNSNDIYIRIDMLRKERDYLISNKKYRDAVYLTKKIERIKNKSLDL